MLYTLPPRFSFDLGFQLKLLLVLMICTSSLSQTFCGHLVLDYVVEPHTASLKVRKRFLPKVFFALG